MEDYTDEFVPVLLYLLQIPHGFIEFWIWFHSVETRALNEVPFEPSGIPDDSLTPTVTASKHLRL